MNEQDELIALRTEQEKQELNPSELSSDGARVVAGVDPPSPEEIAEHEAKLKELGHAG